MTRFGGIRVQTGNKHEFKYWQNDEQKGDAYEHVERCHVQNLRIKFVKVEKGK